jgi:hypothetical protein
MVQRVFLGPFDENGRPDRNQPARDLTVAPLILTSGWAYIETVLDADDQHAADLISLMSG